MSDYNGPSEPCRVRVLRPLGEIPEGTETDAVFYPELRQFMVRVPGKYYNYSCAAGNPTDDPRGPHVQRLDDAR